MYPQQRQKCRRDYGSEDSSEDVGLSDDDDAQGQIEAYTEAAKEIGMAWEDKEARTAEYQP